MSYEELRDQNGQPFNLWLQQKFGEFVTWYSLRNNKIPSQSDWARHLGITNTNLSQYLLGNRKPNVEQADLLAQKLGVQVYDRLGMPRKMPKDKILYFIADNWNAPELDEEFKKQIQELIRNRLAETGQKGRNRESHA